MMKCVLLLLVALASCVIAEVANRSPQSPAGAVPVQAQTSAPAPAMTYEEPQVDHQNYYYYYHPVQEQKTKGLFDFRKDSDLITIIIIGVLFVGGLLVALSYLELPKESRTLGSLNLPYHDLYELATKVYQAVSKKY